MYPICSLYVPYTLTTVQLPNCSMPCSCYERLRGKKGHLHLFGGKFVKLLEEEMAGSMTVKSATRVAQGQRFVIFMLQYPWVFVGFLA